MQLLFSLLLLQPPRLHIAKSAKLAGKVSAATKAHRHVSISPLAGRVFFSTPAPGFGLFWVSGPEIEPFPWDRLLSILPSRQCAPCVGRGLDWRWRRGK